VNILFCVGIFGHLFLWLDWSDWMGGLGVCVHYQLCSAGEIWGSVALNDTILNIIHIRIIPS
jgi:hypothetical protein